MCLFWFRLVNFKFFCFSNHRIIFLALIIFFILLSFVQVSYQSNIVWLWFIGITIILIGIAFIIYFVLKQLRHFVLTFWGGHIRHLSSPWFIFFVDCFVLIFIEVIDVLTMPPLFFMEVMDYWYSSTLSTFDSAVYFYPLTLLFLVTFSVFSNSGTIKLVYLSSSLENP